jgi:hypothetical protein
MKELRRRVPELSRERLVNPHTGRFEDRARNAAATDLRENFRVESLAGGYSRVVPLDSNRKLER